MSFASRVGNRQIAMITRLLDCFRVVENRQMAELFSYMGNDYGRVMARLHREGLAVRSSDSRYLTCSEFVLDRTVIASSVMCFWAFIKIKDKVQDFCAGDPPAIVTVAAKNKDYDLIPIKPNNINLINSTIDDIPERSVRFLVTRDLQLVANIDRRVKNDYVLLVGDDGVIETYEL